MGLQEAVSVVQNPDSTRLLKMKRCREQRQWHSHSQSNTFSLRATNSTQLRLSLLHILNYFICDLHTTLLVCLFKIKVWHFWNQLLDTTEPPPPTPKRKIKTVLPFKPLQVKKIESEANCLQDIKKYWCSKICNCSTNAWEKHHGKNALTNTVFLLLGSGIACIFFVLPWQQNTIS